MSLGPQDRLDIADLVARYAAYADARELDGLADLFTVDAELVLPDPPADLGPVRSVIGRPAITAGMAGLDGFPLTLHALLGHVVDAGERPGTATGVLACSAHHVADALDGDIRDLVWHLHYRDRYRQEAGRWRFERRELQIDWIQTHPVRTRRRGHHPQDRT